MESQKNITFDRLTLQRSQPVQGQQVDVQVYWNNQLTGELRFTFSAWLKIKKLLEKGIEADGREDHALKVKLEIRGVLEQQPRPAASVIHTEDDDAEETADLAAIAAAEAQQATQLEVVPELIRSLRRENADEN